jgi:peptide-methionine (R)-S-oxide reductase
MRSWVLLLVAVSAAVACGQTRPEGKVTGKQPASPGQAADTGSKPKKQDAAKQAGQNEASDKIIHTEQEWRKLLTREQFEVLRKKGTERPFENKYDRHFEPGTYACAACGQELFSSDTKFNSGCGWPAFFAAKAGDRVKLTPDYSVPRLGLRTEVTCARCGSHLGHVFDDAPQTPTGQRFCINSVSLKFIPAESKDKPQGEATAEQNKPDKRDDKQPKSRK